MDDTLNKGGVTELDGDLKRIILRIGDQVVEASTIDAEPGNVLFNMGILSQIRAAGFYFTNLTDLGQEVAIALRAQAGEKS